MVSGNQGAVAGVVRSLRRTGHEAQFTQILAAFAQADRKFAAQLIGTWLEHADRNAVVRLGAIPSELNCEPEHHAFDDRGVDRGFVDLHFWNEEADFTLFVELKLHSGYGVDQLARYRQALSAIPGFAGLLGMTTWLPKYGEEEVTGDPRWLGSVRWARAFRAMRALEPGDQVLTQLWHDVLDVIREQGDFGVMDIDREAVEGWARWKEGRRQLTALLEDIHEPILALLRNVLAEHRQEPVSGASAKEHRFKERLVYPWGESIHIEYKIPATGHTRLWVQFGSDQKNLDFTVEARHGNHRILKSPTPKVRDATARLREAGFQTGDYWGAYWSRPHSVKEWLNDGQVQDELLRLAEGDLRALVESGIFEALNEVPEEAQAQTIPADAEDPDA